MKIEVYEVDERGKIIENYMWDEEEINDAIRQGRNIITTLWQDRLFTPSWDFSQGKWIEGLSESEVNARLQEIEEQNNKLSAEDLNTLALFELAQQIEELKGGL